MASINYSSGTTKPLTGLIDKLNGVWHKQALMIFFAIVLLHWVEHLVQAHQVWVLGMARPKSLGALGAVFPWLISSEGLHYFYALVMLGGLFLLRPAFVGRARVRWNIALGIQAWHYFEHTLLLAQVLLGVNLLGKAVPTSVLQLFFPRMEVHLFYNAIVFIPMVLAMWYHFRPPASDQAKAKCNCVHATASASA